MQTARVSLSQAMEQVQLTRNSLEKARKNEQMALERYTEGKVSIVEMIEAQNYRQISQTNYVQAKSFCTRTLFRIAESFKQILDKTNHHEKHILPFTKERNLSVPIVNGKY